MFSKRFKLLFVGVLFFFSLPAILQAQRMSPQSLNFGSVPEFTSSSLPVTMSNPGPWPLTIRSIRVPANYSQSNNCFNNIINPNSSCTMTVTFAPGALGTLSGSIQTTSDSNGVNTSASVSVTGVGGSPLTGYINPKYVVVAVVYVPTGDHSFVNYRSSTLYTITL